MSLHHDRDLNTRKKELQSAQAELDEITHQLRTFEELVDKRLGSLLDELIQLNAETTSLDEQLRRIREARLFGNDLLSYLDGAPRPPHPHDLTVAPPDSLPTRKSYHLGEQCSAASAEQLGPDIKVVYRKLARRHHPDLARNDADRIQSNEQMKEINQAYEKGDLPALMRLAGFSIPYGVSFQLQKLVKDSAESLPDIEKLSRKLQEVRQQIIHLSSLPIVKLSLEVKLARHQGRDLLREMADELGYKVQRKIAERDYLRAQIDVSLAAGKPD